MKSFEFFLPTKLVFEKHALEQAGIYAKQLHMKKPLLIIDRQLMQYSFAKRLLAAFPEADLYAEVEVNPTISSVNHCARFAQRHHNDGMIAMGGGSCMDTAKGACAAAAANTDVGLFLDGAAERMEVPKQILPLIAIPTTSGTGSEVSQYAVLTDEKTLRKDSISSSNICPDVALVDPTLTIGLPKSLTVSTGLDVLSHALEAMLSRRDNPLTDLLALEALRLVFTWLPICVEDPGMEEARASMAYASTLAGIAMSHCCGILPHGMGCPLSGHYQVPHGLAVGVLQRYALLHMGHAMDAVCDRIMRYVDASYHTPLSEATHALVHKIETLFKQLACPMTLASYHLDEAGIQQMSEDALQHGCTGLHPIAVSKEDILGIYRELKGGGI